MGDNKNKKFAKIYDQNVEKIYRFVFLKTGVKDIAEDLTSQVFSKTWQRFRIDGNLENPSAYLYQVARAEMANFFRKKAKQSTLSIEDSEIMDAGNTPEQTQIIQADLSDLQKALGLLDEESQNLVTWRYIEQMPIKQVAIMCGRPEGTVRVMLHRAIKELREKIENL